MPGRVEIDTSKLQRYIGHLADALESGGPRVAQAAAERTAAQIAGDVPVLTGRLRASVTVADVGEGYAVSYGSGVPYARKIERRDGTVSRAVDSAADPYYRAQLELAQMEARRA
jgi:hypothetical protein